MKRRIFVSLLCMFMLLSAAPAWAEPTHIDRVIAVDDAFVNINADVYMPDRQILAVYEAVRETWSEYDMPALFLDGQNYETHYQSYRDGAMYPYYTTGSGTNLIIAPGRFSFDTDVGAALYEAYYIDMSCRRIDAVPGLSVDDALDMVRALASGLDVELVYDASNATAQSCTVELNGKVSQQDFYIMTMPYAYDGVRMSTELFYLSSIDYYGDNGFLEVFVTTQGVVSCSNNGKYYRALKVQQEAEALSLDAALDCFERFMQSLLLEESVPIVRIALEYVPMPNPATVDTELLVPAWAFYMNEQQVYVYFNALTGDLII